MQGYVSGGKKFPTRNPSHPEGRSLFPAVTIPNPTNEKVQSGRSRCETPWAAKEGIKDILVGIDTRLVSDPAPSQTASPVSSGPQKILVELPDNVATNESIGKLLDEKLPSASTNETVINMLAALTDSLSNGVAKILTDNINGEVKDALYEGFRKEFAKERKALYDIVSDLRYKVQSLVTGQWWLATPKWVYLIFSVLFLTSIGLGIWCYNLYKENEQLQKVEWLYRYERVSYDAEGIRNMMLREEAMMVGNRQEQDSIKEMTIRLERRKSADRTHVYFRPSDPWTPESNNHLW